MGVVCLGVRPLTKRSMLHHWDGNISKSLIYAFVTACYSGGVIMFFLVMFWRVSVRFDCDCGIEIRSWKNCVRVPMRREKYVLIGRGSCIEREVQKC